MTTMKDNFSARSADYARFRPGYPPALFEFLFENCSAFHAAWDCATGNGQIAVALAERFERVTATDISQSQLDNAAQRPNVEYRLEAVEASSLEEKSLDLVVAGQAAHWFDLEKFYPEVRRVLRPGGLLALVGYHLIRVDEETDAVVNHLYRNVLGKYWDAERYHVDAAYTTLPFPFEEITLPALDMTYDWTLDHLLGYLGTWSAVQHFVRKNDAAPLSAEQAAALRRAWPKGEVKTARFPIFGRVGRVPAQSS
jgi:SAM-dependent methyltransferase